MKHSWDEHAENPGWLKCERCNSVVSPGSDVTLVLTKCEPDVDPATARAAGCTFYELPKDVAEGKDLRGGIDPLVRPVIDAINSTGVCWTAESCQGHPDALEPRWVDNVEPMLRLVYRSMDEGVVWSALLQACRSMEAPPDDDDSMTMWGRPQAVGLKVFPCMSGQPEWCEVLIYTYASTAWSRNRGIEALARFAQNLLEATR